MEEFFKEMENKLEEAKAEEKALAKLTSSEDYKNFRMSLGILENKRFSNSSNNGISASRNSVIAVTSKNFLSACERDTGYSVESGEFIVLIEPWYGGFKATPVKEKKKNSVGWMMGGTYLESSDSRFSELFGGPMPFHDREESAAEYATYSN